MAQGTGKDFRTSHRKLWTLGEVRRAPVKEVFFGHSEAAFRLKKYPVLRLTPEELGSLEAGGDGTVRVPSAENRTAPNAVALVFNRVPKCGSSVLKDVIRRLAPLNNFNFRPSNVYWDHHLTLEAERRFLGELAGAGDVPVAAERHVYFVDATSSGLGGGPREGAPSPPPSVVWINLVRDPVDRWVSMFYFLRSPDRWKLMPRGTDRPPKVRTRSPPPSPVGSAASPVHIVDCPYWPLTGCCDSCRLQAWFEKDLESCVLAGDPECVFKANSTLFMDQQVTFFCGSALECLRVNSRVALLKAMHNVEKHYSVVGLSSDMGASLGLMEAYIPRFFRGAADLYAKLGLLRPDDVDVGDVHAASTASNNLTDPINRRRGRRDRRGKFVKNITANKRGISGKVRSILKDRMFMEWEFFQFVTRRFHLQMNQVSVRNWQ